jgi:mono/diheme cytochrome c family protein
MPAFRRNLATGIAVLAIGVAGVMYRDLLTAALTTNPTPRTPESIARGRALWDRHCALCHGSTGRGDGPAAAHLKQLPDDLSAIAPPPIFPDGVVAYRIANGTEFMPAWKAVLGDAQIWDLVHFIRSLGPTPSN